MKRRSRMVSLALAAALVMGLAACGGGTKSAKQVLEEAKKLEQGITSMNAEIALEMEMVMGMDGEEERMAMTSTTHTSMFSDPLKMYVDMTLEVDGESQNMAIYAQETDGNYTIYASDGSNWYNQVVELTDLEQYNAASNMQMYLDSTVELEEAGSETVNGVDTYKYTGEITGEAMREIMEDSGAMNSFGDLASLGMDEDAIDEMLDELGGMPISIWIDKSTCYPVRYEMDMSQPMDAMMSKLFQALSETYGEEMEEFYVNIPKLNLIMDCSDINAVEDFEIPAEALAAQ